MVIFPELQGSLVEDPPWLELWTLVSEQAVTSQLSLISMTSVKLLPIPRDNVDKDLVLALMVIAVPKLVSITERRKSDNLILTYSRLVWQRHRLLFRTWVPVQLRFWMWR
jgi:hypothetical protein